MSGPKTGQYQMSLPAVGSWPCWVTIQRLRALTLVVGGRGSGGLGGWVVADDAGAGAVGDLGACVGEDAVLVVVWGDEGPG